MIKPLLLFVLPALLAGPLAAAPADAKNEIKTAAQKLAGQANYSWTATSKAEGASANWRMGPTEGKTEKGGYTYFSSSVGDNNFQVAFKGAKSAINRQGDWESADELESTDNAWMARRLRAFKAPAEEAADLVDRAKELKSGEGGVYSGDLTEQGIKEILSRYGRGNVEAKGAKGWVKFWSQNGVLTKYEYNIQATITVGGDQREIEINRTTSVAIKDVGTTKLSVPEPAKKKLS